MMNKVIMDSFNNSLKAITDSMLEENAQEMKETGTFGVQGVHFNHFETFDELQDKPSYIEETINDLLL